MLTTIRLTLLTLVAVIALYGCAAAPALVAGGAVAGAAAVDRREAATIIEDNDIELSINKAIYTDPTLKNDVHINVTSYNHAVLLTGEAPTTEMRNKVVSYAQHTARVKKIYNETIVAPPSEFSSRRMDAWITTQVKSSLLNIEGLKAMHVKVVTENQIVYLMGMVTRKEGDLAAGKARQVKDVKQIIKLFEYITLPAK
jgi:osmotically-inducible protein OsmY